jgi:hypothetical protein
MIEIPVMKDLVAIMRIVPSSTALQQSSEPLRLSWDVQLTG